MVDPDSVTTPPAVSRWGIRARVVLWYLGLLAVALVIAVLALRQFLTVGLEESVRASLTQEAEQLAVFSEGTDPATGEPYGDDVEAIFTDFIAGNVPEAAEGSFFLVGGEPFGSDRGAPLNLLKQADLVQEWAAISRPTFGEATTEVGPVRWLAVPLTTDGETVGTFVATHFLAPELREIDQAVRLMVLISGGMLLAVSLVGWLTVGTVVAPIRRLTHTAQNISDAHLSERIPVTGNDEVAALTRTFNTMLDRLEDAFSDQRRFLDDIGHELRTPLTIVRGHLELLPESRAEREQSLALCLDEIDRMNRYVTDLILLAKAERPDFLHVAPVELIELTEGMRARAEAVTAHRAWQVEATSRAVIEADPQRLTQAWLNLVTNAVQHTEPGGRISIGSAVADGNALLWVSDDGPGVSLDEQEHIFERFGRGRDTALARSEGTGLGLAIVGAIARAHRGHVHVESQPGHGARFTISVPICPPAELDDEIDEITADSHVGQQQRVGVP